MLPRLSSFMATCRLGCSSLEEEEGEDGEVLHLHSNCKAGVCAEGPSELSRLSSVPIYLRLSIHHKKELNHIVGCERS